MTATPVAYSPIPAAPPQQQSLFDQEDRPDDMLPAVQMVDNLVKDADELYRFLSTEVIWTTYFKSRNSRSFGVSYHNRSGIKRYRALPDFLSPLCQRIELAFGFMPNNCLVNDYQSGDNYISFHSDQDMEMNDHTGVVIVSLGAVREMVLRRIEQPAKRYCYPMPQGSGFYMTDALQRQWQHGIMKQPGAGRRISLSFRSLQVGSNISID